MKILVDMNLTPRWAGAFALQPVAALRYTVAEPVEATFLTVFSVRAAPSTGGW
ncbi:MAG: hypothetical protein LBS86_03870 [Treponema sp.]|nr:hypothetical protein [Treponema sp.]